MTGKPTRGVGRPLGKGRSIPKLPPPPPHNAPHAPPDQSLYMPSQDFVNITIPVTETTAQHAEPSPVVADPAPWGTLSWSPS